MDEKVTVMMPCYFIVTWIDLALGEKIYTDIRLDTIMEKNYCDYVMHKGKKKEIHNFSSNSVWPLLTVKNKF